MVHQQAPVLPPSQPLPLQLHQHSTPKKGLGHQWQQLNHQWSLPRFLKLNYSPPGKNPALAITMFRTAGITDTATAAPRPTRGQVGKTTAGGTARRSATSPKWSFMLLKNPNTITTTTITGISIGQEKTLRQSPDTDKLHFKYVF